MQADASELERIENLLDRFNVFEAIGIVSKETVHSRFLAFLLDPQRNHGLDASFLEGFLQKVSESANWNLLPSGGSDLRQTTVLTEVPTSDGRMDILLANEASQWAMMIENKIATTEHSNQLDRYYRSMLEAGPGWDPSWDVVCVYLTPYGDSPSHEAYIPISYRAVCEIVDAILENRGSTLSLDVRVAMKHYTDMVRRNVVGDSEIAELCEIIYRQHQRAFDMVFQHRFARQETIRELLLRLIRQNEKLFYNDRWTNYPAEEYISFGVRDWDSPTLRVAQDYTKTDHILLFSVWSWASPFPDQVTLHLEIGSGDSHTREKLFNMVKGNQDIFELTSESREDIAQIYRRSLLMPAFYENATNQQREEEIRKHWNEFLDRDLPLIEAAVRKETWI